MSHVQITRALWPIRGTAKLAELTRALSIPTNVYERSHPYRTFEKAIISASIST